jgi:hypothetical protein
MGFIFSKFLPAVVKQILPSDDFSWTIIIFSKTSESKNVTTVENQYYHTI